MAMEWATSALVFACDVKRLINGSSFWSLLWRSIPESKLVSFRGWSVSDLMNMIQAKKNINKSRFESSLVLLLPLSPVKLLVKLLPRDVLYIAYKPCLKTDTQIWFMGNIIDCGIRLHQSRRWHPRAKPLDFLSGKTCRYISPSINLSISFQIPQSSHLTIVILWSKFIY
jgi:hypothetical protein